MRQALLFFVVNFVIVCIKCGFTPREVKISETPSEDVGEPLNLTALLNNGNYTEAQNRSKVTPDIGNMTSYSGFFTVNEECESNLWFWFFPAKKNWTSKSLLLWLQGGPGSTSLFGLFEEMGPFQSFETGLKEREYSWNVENNVLFMDQPVGTGYSYTGKNCYPQNETAVGEDLYQGILQFHKLFPIFTNTNFIITGESYAGHYIPALAFTIDKYNPTADTKINLVGMVIGGTWSDPKTQSNYSEFLYQHSLIDDNQKAVYIGYEKQFQEAINQKDWETAALISDAFMGGIYDGFINSTKVDVYNYIKPPSSDQNWQEFIESADTRRALHVGALPFQSGDNTFQNLRLDVVQSVKPWVEALLDKYYFVSVNGQLDIICAYPLTISFLRSLNWTGQSQYLNATRHQWCVGEDLSGFTKGEFNLFDIVVLDAGHYIATDKPSWAYTMINSIASGTRENPLHGLGDCNSTNSTDTD